MKLKGQSIKPPKEIPIPIPREGEDDIILMAGPVTDMSEFKRLCPEPPVPTETNIKTGVVKKLVNDPKFLAKMDKHGDRRTNYIIVKSLCSTPDLEWETVSLDDPDSWDKYEDELLQHFTQNEIEYIISRVIVANFPTEERQKEALERFTLRQVEGEEDISFPTDELNSTPSGEPVNV